MVVNNNNSGLRLYTPSLPDTTKFIASFLLLLHRSIFNGRFGNFIRIVVVLHACHLFPEKEAPKTEILFFWHSTSTQSVRDHAVKTGSCAKRSAFRFLLISPPPFFFWHDRTKKTKARAFTFIKKPQQERAQETFEASSSPTNWWAKDARGDDVLITESNTHRRKMIQVSRVCWDYIDVDSFFLMLATWVGESSTRAQSTVMVWQLNPSPLSMWD